MGSEWQYEAFLDWMYANVDAGTGVIFLAVDDNDEGFGIIAGVLAVSPYWNSPFVQQTLWYVDNAWRSSGVSLHLDRTLANWGRSHGATRMESSHLAKGQKLVRPAMEKLGYKPQHVTYVREL